MNEWQQRENEPTQWFARFERYLMLGEKRSIEAVWQAEQKRTGSAKVSQGQHEKMTRPSRHWYAAAKTWQWASRAAAYDQQQRDLEKAEWESKRKKARERRLQLLDAYSMPLIQAMAQFDPKAAKPGDLGKLFEIFMEQSRLEYDDLPTSRVDVTSGGHELKGLTLTADKFAGIRAQAKVELEEFDRQFYSGNGHGHG